MRAQEHPCVSVVIPVHNGEAYLRDCLDSVLAQTYDHWECIISDNRSTDATAEIAERYARGDKRIKVFATHRFVDATQNHNIVCGHMSKASKYCKMLHADDVLLHDCIRLMVDVAERNPRVGVVGSYVLYGAVQKCDRIPHGRTVVPGHEICKAAFRGDYTVFATPSALLMRSALFQKHKAFYDENLLYCDIDACFRVLTEWDFGCVHRVLSRIRVHAGSNTAKIDKRADRAVSEIMGMVFKYGPHVCTKSEYEEILEYRMRWFYGYIARKLLHSSRWNSMPRQLEVLRQAGLSFELSRLVIAIGSELPRVLFRQVRPWDAVVDRI